MLHWMLLAACGQYVSAEDALIGGTTAAAAEVTLASRDTLGDATRLLHYGQQALLMLHTEEAEVSISHLADASTTTTMRLVAYDELIASPEAQVVLADALANLAAVDPVLLDGGDEKLAYWLNLYNLWAIQIATTRLAADPDWIGAAQDDFLMFSTSFVVIGDRQLTLNQLEHGVIRGDPYAWETYFIDQPELLSVAQGWHDDLWPDGIVDARIHVGLNCISRSCPDTLQGAFTAATLDADLDALAAAFVANPAKGAGPDGISQLFSWFRADFEADVGSIEAFIQRHRTAGDSDVDYTARLNYDWSLNGR